MTKTAQEVITRMDIGMDAEQILADGIGSTIYEIEFIIAQIRIARGE